jgi:hypothetical protein
MPINSFNTCMLILKQIKTYLDNLSMLEVIVVYLDHIQEKWLDLSSFLNV